VRAYLRDFDNAKVIDGLFDRARLSGVPADCRAELVDAEPHAWERFVYCLFVNHVAEAAAALADGDRADEARLWCVVRSAVERARDAAPTDLARTRLDELLARPTLPAKKNLVTRLFKRRDHEAPFGPVPNPIAASRC
jgi:siderophore synthetase component